MTDAPKAEWSVRLATSSEWPALAALRHLSHSQSFKPYASEAFLTSRLLGDYERDWKTHLQDRRFFTWVAVIDEIIVGMVSIKENASYKSVGDDGRVAYLEGMHVRPGSMRRGIGRALIQRALKQARSDAYSAVYLYVMKGNFPAMRLFQSEGWNPVQEIHKGEEGVPILLCRREV